MPWPRPAVVTIAARARWRRRRAGPASSPGFDGAGRGRTPACDREHVPLCAGTGFSLYSVEVVQRIGYDSFTPDSGVLIVKTRTAMNSCGYGCHAWAIDAHPEDINGRLREAGRQSA